MPTPNETSALVGESIFPPAVKDPAPPKDNYSIYSLPRLIVTLVNAHRLSTRFTNLTIKSALILARENHLLDKLERVLGNPVNIDILDAPLGIYNTLSVNLFILRNFINIADILQHTFFPDTKEDENLTKMARFSKGLYKHHTHLANDIVWGTVNAVCVCAASLGLSVAITNYLMVGFTGFDVALLTVDLYLKTEEYKHDLLTKPFSEWEKLDSDYEKFRSAQLFYIAAASIMLASFGIGFLFLPPSYISACFLVCNVAIAMYFSGDSFGKWSDAHRILNQTKVNKGDVAKAEENVQKTWDDLGFAMAKNTIAPFIFISAFTVSVPLAIGLTLAYSAYEVYNVGLEAGYLKKDDEAASGPKGP